MYYDVEKNCFYRHFEKYVCLYNNFSVYRKLGKAASEPNRLTWFKSFDGNLKSQSKQFWRFMTFL